MVKYIVLLLICYSSSVLAQQEDYGAIAKHIVNESAMVKPGELVYVYGGIHAASLIESIVSECTKIGANVVPVITPDKSASPIKENNKAGHPPGMAHVLINIHPWVEDPEAVYKDLQYEQVVQLESVNQDNVGRAKRPVRTLHVSYPTRALAESLKVNYDEYKEMMLKALSFDYTIQRNNINRLKNFLEGSNQVRITTEAGTDFSFLVNNRPIIVTDGRISKEEELNASPFSKGDKLPAGMIEVSILETSGIGHVVIPHAECNYKAMTDISFDLNKGKMENFKAKEGADCFKNKLDRYDGPKDFLSSISFGFNTELKPMEENGGLYWPKSGVAILWITFGSNQLLGGKNPSSCGQFSFPLLLPTVEMDGKVVLKSVKH